jgi:iron complex transport system substrate-binding protein
MPDSRLPHRIACLQPSATVILAAVGELDRVVACTKYCADVVPEVREDLHDGRRLIIADSWSSKASEILAASPDFVIAAVPYQEAAVVAEILKGGHSIPWSGSAYAERHLHRHRGDLGLRWRGRARCESDRRHASGDRRRATPDRKPSAKARVREEWGKPILASQPWVAELVQAAGGEFLGKPGEQCSAEEIARLDPEVIIAAWCGAGDRVPLARSFLRKRLGEYSRRAEFAGVLHLRRTVEYSRAHTGGGVARAGGRDSSRSICTAARSA